MIFWVLRTSLGDFDVQKFQNLPVALQIASWVAWVFIVALNMLIFLNFLIAVIGDVYGQVMETRLEEQYQTLALVIREMGLMYNSFSSLKIKPAKIAVARQAATEENYEKTQGFLVQIKGLLNKNLSQIESLASKLSSYNAELSTKIGQTCKKLDDEN